MVLPGVVTLRISLPPPTIAVGSLNYLLGVAEQFEGVSAETGIASAGWLISDSIKVDSSDDFIGSELSELASVGAEESGTMTSDFIDDSEESSEVSIELAPLSSVAGDASSFVL
jgi:hypothetical protein